MSSKDLAEELNALAAKMGAKLVPADGGAWGAPAAPAGGLPFVGVSVPIKVELPGGGSLKCHLALPPEVAANPSALLDAIKRLMDMGLPLDVYHPRSEGGGWGGGNGNGYQRRDFGGRPGYGGGYGGGRSFGRGGW